MPKTLLVVDDKPELRLLLQEYFTQEGYRVLTAANGAQALELARRERPDLIILDIMMPEMDGYAFLRTYTREAPTPIILLTARVDETDRVLGLELGADDYVTKPFSLRELAARVRAVLRRLDKARAAADAPARLQVGDVVLDTPERRVWVAGREITDLTPTEFALLETLMRDPGRVFTRAQLWARAAGEGRFLQGDEHTVNVHIHNLRRKIEPNPREPRYILTVYGVGYKFRRED